MDATNDKCNMSYGKQYYTVDCRVQWHTKRHMIAVYETVLVMETNINVMGKDVPHEDILLMGQYVV